MDCSEKDSAMTTTKPHMTEAEAVMLVRNALLVAGNEMGEGDHWPVIKSTINAIEKDYEALLFERDIHAEMKRSFYERLERMERILPTCPKEEQEAEGPALKNLREIFDAYFSGVDESKIIVDEEDYPEHTKRAKLIIEEMMEDEHDDE